MAITRYQWQSEHDQIAQLEVASNSFGRLDAALTAAKGADPAKLSLLADRLAWHGITAYPDIKDGNQVLTAYGFGRPERLVALLKQEGFVSSAPNISTESREDEKSQARKFVQRYSLQMAAASGLLGHASMYALAARTGNKHFMQTAVSYTAADAVIAAYGTDKSVTADPLMQDFKRYLWEQGIDNDFVKADRGKVSFLKSSDEFLKKYGFQVANAAGAYGNLGMIMGGLAGSQKDWGMFFAGLTSIAGAGLQIFGTENKPTPEEQDRKSIGANILNYFNAHPIQIAAATNFADPLLLTHSALMTNQRNRRTITENSREIHKAQKELFALAQEGKLNLSALPQGIQSAIEAERGLLEKASQLRQKIETLEGPKFKGWGPIGAAAEAIRDLRGPKTQQLKELYSELKGYEKQIVQNSAFIGESAADLHKLLRGPHLEEATKIANNIQKWQLDMKMAARGGKVEPYIRGLVAVFYGGATMLRLISRKTAGVDENRDAFNEVYAAAAESLLNLPAGEARESMLLQMGHYLSTHPKMKEPSDVILTKLRERTENFEHNPFVSRHLITPETMEKPANENAKPSPVVAVSGADLSAEGRLETEVPPKAVSASI